MIMGKRPATVRTVFRASPAERWDIARARLRGAMTGTLLGGALVASAVSGLVAVRLVHERPREATFPSPVVFAMMGAGVVLICGLQTARLFGRAAAKRLAAERRWSERAGPPAMDPPSEFPIRLDQFLHEQRPAHAGHPSAEPRREFFLAEVPLFRRGPKPARHLRVVLERIRQLLPGAG